MHFILSNCR